MTKPNDGGPAFPHVEQHIPGQPPEIMLSLTSGGMSLRDYFAAKALTLSYDDSIRIEAVAEWAYEIADAMIAARQGKADEPKKPVPKFKQGCRVHVRDDAAMFAGETGVVKAAFPDPFTHKQFKYRVLITSMTPEFLETFYEEGIEAVKPSTTAERSRNEQTGSVPQVLRPHRRKPSLEAEGLGDVDGRLDSRRQAHGRGGPLGRNTHPLQH
jgi:hypothetical protein